jgi:hypothetical protein
LSEKKPVKQVLTFEGIKDGGMYLQFSQQEGFGTYEIPLSAPVNPGALVIYSLKLGKNTPLFTVFQDGRIQAAV